MVAYSQASGWQFGENSPKSDVTLDGELGLSDVLTTAEQIENRRLRLYLRLAQGSQDSELRGLCHWFTARSQERARTLARKWESLGGLAAAPSHPGPLAALAFFAADESLSERTRMSMTSARLLRSEIDRSRSAVAFYEGLKGFTQDQTARAAIDEIIGQERDGLGELIAVQAGAAEGARQ